MKKRFFMSFIVLLMTSHIAAASTALSSSKESSYKENILNEAEQHGLSRVQLDESQTFRLTRDGTVLGTLIQGKGWVREVQPVCFIGWSKDGKKIDAFIPTVGQGDWETVGCHKVDSVGLISKKDDANVKVAVVYTTEAPGRYSNAYFILGVEPSDDNLIYDEKTTVKFQNSYLKNIAALRKAYQQ